VNCPDHYKLPFFKADGKTSLEAIDLCEYLFTDDPLLFQALEYLLRCKKKGQYLSDLQKCNYYLNRAYVRDNENEKTSVIPVDTWPAWDRKFINCKKCRYHTITSGIASYCLNGKVITKDILDGLEECNGYYFKGSKD
jgi:hypothetical protein